MVVCGILSSDQDYKASSRRLAFSQGVFYDHDDYWAGDFFCQPLGAYFCRRLAPTAGCDIIFFAAFLVWAILAFKAAKKRDRVTPPAPLSTTKMATIATVVIGLLAYVVFALYLHAVLIGVPVFS